MQDDLEQLRKRAERLEQLAKDKEQERELNRRIKIAKAYLRQDTVVAKTFALLKKRLDKEIGEIK